MRTEINKLITFITAILIITLLMFVEVISANEILAVGDFNTEKNKILVVTNSEISNIDSQRMLFEPEINNTGKHHYFIAQQNGDSWIFSKQQKLSSLFNYESKYEDWVVFVHGDGKSLSNAVQRASEIQGLHKVNVIVYAWPSKNPEYNAIKNFKNSYSNIEKASVYFKSFLVELHELTSINTFKTHNLSIFFHSLGNYYLERLVADNYQKEIPDKLFDNLIVNAAAVETKGHAGWLKEINFSERIYVNSNDADFSLTGLKIFSRFGHQLGEGPKKEFAENAIYVNFTKAVGFPGSMGPSHSYYFGTITQKSENIKNYYTNILHGNEAHLKNPDLFVLFDDQVSYAIKF